jgi:hypothetical protein
MGSRLIQVSKRHKEVAQPPNSRGDFTPRMQLTKASIQLYRVIRIAIMQGHHKVALDISSSSNMESQALWVIQHKVANNNSSSMIKEQQGQPSPNRRKR